MQDFFGMEGKHVLQYLAGETGSGGFSRAATNDLQTRRTVVTVLLASAYDTELINWVFSSYKQFNLDVEDKWEMLVPMERTTKDFENSRVADFNVKLAKEIAESCSVDRKHMPAILFEDFSKKDGRLYVSVRDKSLKDLRDFFEICVEKVNALHPLNTTTEEYRAAVAESIINSERIRKGLKFLIKVTPIVSRVAKSLSDKND